MNYFKLFFTHKISTSRLLSVEYILMCNVVMFNHVGYVFQASINWEIGLLAFCWGGGSQNQCQICVLITQRKSLVGKKRRHITGRWILWNRGRPAVSPSLISNKETWWVPAFSCNSPPGLTHLDVEHSDEVGPLWVVFDQTGHSTAPLQPAAAPVCSVHLDHRWTQSLNEDDKGQDD